MRSSRLGALAGALLSLGCGHVSGGGGPDAGDDSDTETDEPECASQGADDIGGGCAPGYFCNSDHECDQECMNNDQCVQLHALYWICNAFGQCEFEGTGDVGAP